MNRITCLLALLLLLACASGAVAVPTQSPAVAQTMTAKPTGTPVPTAKPTTTPETLAGAALYEQVAREAARPLDTRAAVGLPAGEWAVTTPLPNEVQVTYPMTAGMSNEQTVRQGQRQIGAIVKALFDTAPELVRVNVIGTLPLGGQEAPAISVVLTRDEYAGWSGNAAELPGLQVSQRLR